MFYILDAHGIMFFDPSFFVLKNPSSILQFIDVCTSFFSVTGKPIERKFSEQNLGAPPSYEDAVAEVRSPVHSER